MSATRLFCALLLSFCFARTLGAQSWRVFGSAGAETQMTPADGSSALNPGNAGNVPYRTNVADVTAFAELLPDDRRWKVSAKLRADASDRGDDELSVGELYVVWHLTDSVTLTGGRVIEKWGTGYAWNPAAFISPRKNPSDPNDRRGSYAGRDMVKLDAMIGAANVAVFALEDGELALRAYKLVGATDVSLFVHHRDRTNVGVSVSRVFGDAIELHAEASREKVLAGGQYTFSNQWNLVVELYHSDQGLSRDVWSGFRDEVRSASDLESFRQVNARYRPLEMGRDYAFVRVAREWQAAHLSTELLIIPSLRDGSSIVRASLTYSLRPNVSLSVLDTEFIGSEGSEMSYMQIERATSFGVRVYF